MQRKPFLVLVCVGLGALASVLSHVWWPSRNDRALHRNSQKVIAQIPTTQGVSDSTIQKLRSLLREDPRDIDAALELARLFILESRATADARPLGYAESALRPWWNDPAAPAEVYILKGTIRQRRHDFPGALSDLDIALTKDPNDPQAWLTRSVVLTVLGRYREALQCCEMLKGGTSSSIVVACAASIDGLTGRAREAKTNIEKILGSAASVSLSSAEKAWLLTLLADVTAWAGDAKAAEAMYKEVISANADDEYARVALFDLWIDQQRYGEVIAMCQKQCDSDGLLLRLAIAQSESGLPSATEAIAVLGQRFEAARMRDDHSHRREESRFERVLKHNPQAALRLALLNWDIQKEPWDARVLMEAARDNGHPAAAKPALDWMKNNHFEDPQMKSIANALETRLNNEKRPTS